jgi:hypothetical protein
VSDLHIRGLVLEWGEVPPRAGPHRDKYLRTSGTEALSRANHLLRATYDALPPELWEQLPSIEASPDSDTVEIIWSTDPRTIRNSISEAVANGAGKTALEAEVQAARALNFLEDDSEFAGACHLLLHRAAAIRSLLIGCPMPADDEDVVWVSCVSRIAHARTGQSVGMTSKRACSVCDQLIEDCDHIPGRVYETQVRHSATGACSFCGQLACDHAVGSVYETEAHAVHVDATMHEVSLVRRPRFPQARISSFGLEFGPESDMTRGARQGILNCTFCLEPCRGLIEMGESPTWLLETLMWAQGRPDA